MTDYQSDRIFNLILRVAVVICLTTLSLSLAVGVGPLTAVMRSGTAFAAFTLLGWATAHIWEIPNVKKTTKQAANVSTKQGKEPVVNEQPANDEPATTSNE